MTGNFKDDGLGKERGLGDHQRHVSVRLAVLDVWWLCRESPHPAV